ncbi:hypothetical protein GCM10009560_70010 [Nonomuraea longicatena]|uniref:Uncharacterized protein n=1 Tax=Nonomuraea longicatena TaxID=83682 RepID=A0ABN1R1K9_9ACTN
MLGVGVAHGSVTGGGVMRAVVEVWVVLDRFGTFLGVLVEAGGETEVSAGCDGSPQGVDAAASEGVPAV